MQIRYLPWTLLLVLLALAGCELARPPDAPVDIGATLESQPAAQPADTPAPPEATAQPPAPPATAMLFFQPPTQTVSQGNTASYQLQLQGVSSLVNLNLEIRFDPARLQVEDAGPAPGIQIAPAEGVANLMTTNNADNNAGVIQFGLNQATGVAVVGNLATVTFRAVSPGSSAINISSVALINPNNESVTVDTASAEAVIQPPADSTPITQQPAATTPIPTSPPVPISPTPTLAPPIVPSPTPTSDILLTLTPATTTGPTVIPVQPTATPTATPPLSAPPAAPPLGQPDELAEPLPVAEAQPLKIKQPRYIPPNSTFGFCYRAQPYENIHTISKNFGVTPFAINLANDLEPPFHIKPPQTIFIPQYLGRGPNVYKVEIGDTVENIAARCNLPASMVARVNNINIDTPLHLPAGATVTLVDGSTAILPVQAVVVYYMAIPVPPFPPPSRYGHPMAPVPFIPYSEPYPRHKDPF